MTNPVSQGDIKDEHIKAALIRDLQNGAIDKRLTFPYVKTRYGLLVDRRIRRIFVELESLGLIKKNGRSYYTTSYLRQQVAA